MEPAAGSFLVASTLLTDPNFAQSVVFLIEHGEGGSLGVIINRPLETPLGELWGEAPPGLRPARIACQGGPVEPNRGLLLHGNGALPSAQELGQGLWVGGELAALAAAWAEGPDRHGPRLFLGHSGWAGGQLARELAEGAWIVRPGDPRLALDPAGGERLWHRLVAGPAGGLRPPSVN